MCRRRKFITFGNLPSRLIRSTLGFAAAFESFLHSNNCKQRQPFCSLRVPISATVSAATARGSHRSLGTRNAVSAVIIYSACGNRNTQLALLNYSLILCPMSRQLLELTPYSCYYNMQMRLCTVLKATVTELRPTIVMQFPNFVTINGKHPGLGVASLFHFSL